MARRKARPARAQAMKLADPDRRPAKLYYRAVTDKQSRHHVLESVRRPSIGSGSASAQLITLAVCYLVDAAPALRPRTVRRDLGVAFAARVDACRALLMLSASKSSTEKIRRFPIAEKAASI